MPERFLVVDDHPLFLEALQLAILAAYPAADIVEATSIETAKSALQSPSPYDLVLLDLGMPGTRGFDGLLELRTLYPKQAIVVVSALDDPRIIHEAMMCGAAGYITKSVRKAKLAEAIKLVMNGGVFLPDSYTPPQSGAATLRKPALARRLASLTPQQLRVLNMVRQGKLNKQIAHELDVGETTIKAHMTEILRKLEVASRTQAVIEVAKIDFETLLDPESASRSPNPKSGQN